VPRALPEPKVPSVLTNIELGGTFGSRYIKNISFTLYRYTSFANLVGLSEMAQGYIK